MKTTIELTSTRRKAQQESPEIHRVSWCGNSEVSQAGQRKFGGHNTKCRGPKTKGGGN